MIQQKPNIQDNGWFGFRVSLIEQMRLTSDILTSMTDSSVEEDFLTALNQISKIKCLTLR